MKRAEARVDPRRVFRPTLGATVLALVGVAVLLGLGTWQVQRLGWKRDLIATLEARTAMPPIELPASIADEAALAYRRVRVTGRYDHEHEMHLFNRTYERLLGVHVVTPLLRSDGGGVVMVNRGWVPLDHEARETRPDGLVEGEVTVTGAVMPFGHRGWLMPDNDAATDTWYFTDRAEMADHAGVTVSEVAPVLVAADADQHPWRYPIGGQGRLEVRNDHLQYALTWYALAVALVVIYVTYHLRRPQDDGGEP